MGKKRPGRVVTRKVRHGDSFQLLSNSLTAGLLTEESYISNAAEFIATGKDSDFRSKFSSLYKKDRFRRIINATKRQVEDFYSNGIFIQGVSSKRTLTLYSCIFEEHADELNYFVALRDQFESHVLRGEFDAALVELDILADSQGESLWYIRNKIIILGMKGSLQEMQEFAEACKKRSTDGFINFLINCFLLIASDPKLHLEKIIKSTILELQEAGSKSSADLISLFFVPRPLYGDARKLICIRLLQSFGVIDQYSLMTKLLSEELTSDEHSGDSQAYDEFVCFLRDIKRVISDHALPDPDALSQNRLNEESLASKLVRMYELDKYDQLFSSFMNSFSSGHTPFAFVNLVAKASAACEERKLPLSSGPIVDLVGLLKNLYKLEVSPNKIHEDISKIIIQLQGFVGCSQLQLCLYKSMPLRYEVQDWIKLAKISKVANSDFTPLSILLTTDADPVLSYKYLSNQDELPAFRRLKARIQGAQAISTRDIDLLMSFADDAAKSKDVYETVSACYCKLGKITELIELAAIALSKHPNAYIAFPMKDLIRQIEDNRICTLDSLIITYYYVDKIDSSKEYLLNESYEEFIETYGVTRPCELFESLDVGDDRTLVFFRDVSNLETMDFLGSFTDSNDLRAERVRVLDYLRDMDLIGSERHSSEVDEIVLEVIVDAGATEFNVAKIDVNDIAIKRNLAEDFSSMHQLYKSVQQEKEQQIIRLEGELLAGASALVAGDKNTTLLKMLNLVEDAFMNDDKHGLDKNLSTEIRHGFFSNLMRSKLEEANLLTEVDESGEYESNIYWLAANALVMPELLVKVDSELKWFSKEFNNLILEAEEWMKVCSDGSSTSRVFNYKTFLDDLHELKDVAEQTAESDGVLDFCIGRLWDKTEACMQEMREKLNVEFKSKVDYLFDELIRRLNDVRSGVVLMELMRAITQTKSDIREDITTASEWFRRSTEYAATARTVGDLVDIAIECFERVKRIRLDVTKDLEELPDFRLEGRDLKAFIIAIVNILENACRHSGYAHATPVKFTMSADNNSWQLQVKNKINTEVQERLQGARVSEIEAKMKGPSSITMMRREGGSGLGKAYNQLRSISVGFDMGVEVLNDCFVARILHVN